MSKAIGTIAKIGGIIAAPFTGGASLALTALGSTLDGGGKPDATPAAATEKAPVVMPHADGEAVQRARRRSITTQAQRGGRSSTMLTSDSDKLGG